MEVDILKKILDTKAEEIPAIQLPKQKVERLSGVPSFKSQFEQGKKFIAEFKRKSPSAGWINQHAKVSQVLQSYTEAIPEVAGFSVLTDTQYFGGGIQDLQEAVRSVSCPVIRKDFIVHPKQIEEAYLSGASAILLIAAALSKSAVAELVTEAESYGLEVLFEIKELEELTKLDDRIALLGVNNRDLRTFETDYRKSIRFAPQLPTDRILISESGLSQQHQFDELEEVGYKGFLVGQGFMELYSEQA